MNNKVNSLVKRYVIVDRRSSKYLVDFTSRYAEWTTDASKSLQYNSLDDARTDALRIIDRCPDGVQVYQAAFHGSYIATSPVSTFLPGAIPFPMSQGFKRSVP